MINEEQLKHLSMDHPIYGLQARGIAQSEEFPGTLEDMSADYIQQRILGEYVPKQFRGNLLFFHSTIIPEWFDPIEPEMWEPFITGQIERHNIVCRYKDLCQPGPLTEIGKIISLKLTSSIGSEVRL